MALPIHGCRFWSGYFTTLTQSMFAAKVEHLRMADFCKWKCIWPQVLEARKTEVKTLAVMETHLTAASHVEGNGQEEVRVTGQEDPNFFCDPPFADMPLIQECPILSSQATCQHCYSRHYVSNQ